VPAAGAYSLLLNSDAPEFAGSGYPVESRFPTETVPYHGFEQSIVVALPPLSLVVLQQPTNVVEPMREQSATVKLKPVKAKPEKAKTEKTKSEKTKVAKVKKSSGKADA
jgi:1,4-alpha-glucan branching enzyme